MPCQSKAQRSMTSLSSEVEWVALVEAFKEVMFTIKLLQIMKISVKHPVTERANNVDVLFMLGYVTAMSHTNKWL